MPVRRTGRRYLGIQVVGQRRFTDKEVVDAVQKGVLRLYGIMGLSQIEPALIDFDEEEQRGILRCSRDHLRRMRAVLALTTEVSGSAAAVHVEMVSGTIKALRSKLGVLPGEETPNR